MLLPEEMAGSMHRMNGDAARSGAAGRSEMVNLSRKNGDRASRLELIGRVQLAYEHFRDTMQRYREDSRPRARIAIAAAKTRLSMLNRALALLALEVAAQPEAA
jgi:hypothetical protein